ncbi:GntR family transcriptional regulator [Streptomyces piniterrae]|uniref:GntR family transcriptional regulator n=1 Tax=Streptomyces piniterrae TaxID=2571125 RepID=UPI001FE74459|nr:GntR family transcriptional regulator [Streptomyces piniterrae]
MTSAHSNAPSAASSGVIHIRARQTSHFTVLANRLAQRAGSAVTVGVAAYIMSLPDGASITIQALCAHFAEGKITIAEALRELEDEGWLERRVVRGPHGRIITRTFAYDLPGAAGDMADGEAGADGETASNGEAGTDGGAGAHDVARASEPPRTPRPARAPEPETTPESAPDTAPEPDPEPQAVDLLARLHHRDRRLLLSGLPPSRSRTATAAIARSAPTALDAAATAATAVPPRGRCERPPERT